MVKSLLDLCISAVCQYQLSDELSYMPSECKQKLLEFFSSHDQLRAADCGRLVCSPDFGRNITELSFYVSDDLTDEVLIALSSVNKRVEKITLVECTKITDLGVCAATAGQKNLMQLELRAMSNITDEALHMIDSPCLHTVDLSGCSKITSCGLLRLLKAHHGIRRLYLNHCRLLDDMALYYIAHYLGDHLKILEYDFPSRLSDPGSAIHQLSLHCPNITQLSIARFFNESTNMVVDPSVEYRIDGLNLLSVDLYANYFYTLPTLPLSITSLRLSVSGEEDPVQLLDSLLTLSNLTSISLQLSVKDADITSVDNANRLLTTLLPLIGDKITLLQVSVPRLFDEALNLIMGNTPNMTELALDVNHLSTHLLQKYFSGGSTSRANRLKSLKICRMRITYRVLFAIARGARNLTELETSHMLSIDDRFVCMLADNCRFLQTVNFNGCKWVSDKGIATLARRCQLREVRIRGTACTDKSIYILAQFCPQLEWISYADFSGKPKFTEVALQHLRDSCIQRVIC